MDHAFYASAPNLKLVQLLSAGYDRCDIEAARRAGVPIRKMEGPIRPRLRSTPSC